MPLWALPLGTGVALGRPKAPQTRPPSPKREAYLSESVSDDLSNSILTKGGAEVELGPHSDPGSGFDCLILRADEPSVTSVTFREIGDFSIQFVLPSPFVPLSSHMWLSQSRLTHLVPLSPTLTHGYGYDLHDPV